MTAPGFEHLPGTPLTDGVFTITDEDEQRVLQVVGGSATPGPDAHPLWAYIATQRGIGTSVAEICALADFDVNDGPMLGSSHLQFHGPLRKGIEYRVTGTVLGIERKRGGTGVFHLLEFREDLRDASGELVASSTSTYVLPRRSDDDT